MEPNFLCKLWQFVTEFDVGPTEGKGEGEGDGEEAEW